MSIDNRDYMRSKPPSGGFGIASWSMVSKLLVINVVVFLLQHTVFYHNPIQESAFAHYFALTGKGLGSGMIFQLVTFQFLHGSPAHLIGNMLGLYFLGRMAEQRFGSKHLLWIYLLGGILGGIAQVLFNLAIGIDAVGLGASASVLAMIFAITTRSPNELMQLLLIPVKFTLRRAALVIFLFNVIGLLFQFRNNFQNDDTAILGHFGGMFMGWAYVTFILPASTRRNSDRKRSASMKKKFGIRVIKNAEMGTTPDEPSSSYTAKEKQKPFVSADVDAILDKISAEGMQSLTDKERKILERSSKKLGRKIDGR